MQAAPPIQDAPSWLPPRATSAASSYHTVLDHLTTSNTGGATDSAESLVSTSAPHHASSDAASTSAPTTPEIEYETIQHTRHGKALVIEHPTLVSFVPTSEIQTAVSVTADRVVIDTIFPPTAVWRAERNARPIGSIQKQDESGKTDEEDLKELLRQHEEQLRETLKAKLTENYDPTGSIKEEIFTTLTQVTRFPDPVGTDLKRYTKDECPCICCDVGCERPLEPYSDNKVESSSASTIAAVQVPPQPSQPKPTQPLESFLEMTETSTGTRNGEAYGKEAKPKHRSGFLTFGRFGRSWSSVDLARHETSNGTGKPVAAPALPAEVTSDAIAPPRSRSFADLVQRRRSKHVASASMSKATSPTFSQPINDEPTTTSRVDSQGLPRQARHSLDTSRPRVDTPLSAPIPPPRRSSKIYAIVHRKPIPAQFSAMPAASMSMYNIGQIKEEEEPLDGVKGNMAGVGAGGRASLDTRQFGLGGHGRSAVQRPETVEHDSSLIGLAL